MAYPVPGKHMKAAMDAQTNLTVFAAVVQLLEGGLLTGYSGTASQCIIAICQKEQQRQLKLMDKAVAASRVAAPKLGEQEGAKNG